MDPTATAKLIPAMIHRSVELSTPWSLLKKNTSKDEDQQAMHGLAYPIAVEFRDIPLLML